MNCGDGENKRREYCRGDRGKRKREGAFGRESECKRFGSICKKKLEKDRE